MTSPSLLDCARIANALNRSSTRHLRESGNPLRAPGTLRLRPKQSPETRAHLWSLLLRRQEPADRDPFGPSWPPSEPRSGTHPNFPNSFGRYVLRTYEVRGSPNFASCGGLFMPPSDPHVAARGRGTRRGSPRVAPPCPPSPSRSS